MKVASKYVLAVLFLFSLKSNWVEAAVSIEVVHGSEAIRPYLDDLASLTFEIYSTYPYLITSSHEEEREYLREHLQEGSGIVILAKEEGKVVGAITGHPLVEAPERMTKTFRSSGTPIDDMYYLGDILLKKEYRGQKIGQKMYEEFLSCVLVRPEFKKVLFCEIVRDKDDPRRPGDFFCLDEFWDKRGFVKHPEWVYSCLWQDRIGEDEESLKSMVYWMKELE